jgi:hypothetical protein
VAEADELQVIAGSGVHDCLQEKNRKTGRIPEWRNFSSRVIAPERK